MTNRLSQTVAAGLVVLAAFGMVQWAWVGHQSLFGLFAVSVAAVIALARTQRASLEHPWPLPPPRQAFPDRDSSVAPSRGRLLMGALGLVCVAAAYHFALLAEGVPALGLVACAALCWRPLIDVRPKTVPLAWLGGLTLLVMAVAAVFRFYKAGAVPQGMICYDEPLCYSIARQIVTGVREIFNSNGSNGQVPFWASALTLRVFGDGILGYRLSPMLSGLMVVGLVALLAKELGGGRLGLIAGAFTSMALWPVAFSRSEYLLASSYLPVLVCMWLLLWGLRRGLPLALAVSGFCMAESVNAYDAIRMLPLLLFILVGATWWREKDARKPILWAAVPFIGGALIGLSPMILWFIHNPQGVYNIYFGKLSEDWIVGANVVATPGFLDRFSALFARIIPNFQNVIWMYTTIGDGPSNCFFISNEPFIDGALLFLVLAGMATCLTRFRKPAYLFVFSWWLLAFLPALVTATPPCARRAMMNMPATMLMGSMGLLTLFELSTEQLKTALANRLVLLGGLCFFGWYAVTNWNTYFVVLNQNIDYLRDTHANVVNGVRAIERENDQSPVYLINFRKTNADNWLDTDDFINNQYDNFFLASIPQTFCQTGPDYFLKGGLFGALDQMPAQFPDKVSRDPLIALTPFHYYLEPLLQKLGGEKVEEIMPAMSTSGPSWADFGFAPHEGPVHRMYRLRNFDPAKLAAIRARYSFPYVSEELIPPASIGTRDSVSAEYFNSPAMFAALDNYEAHPKHWKVGKEYSFTMPDIYFWSGLNYVAQIPMRLRASWTLDVPRDGFYALGAAANLYTTLRVDGKRVFRFRPESTENLYAAEFGELGSPVFLKAGPHRLDVEQIELTWNPIRMQAIRLVWQRPAGQMETLPLENLEPQPFTGSYADAGR